MSEKIISTANGNLLFIQLIDASLAAMLKSIRQWLISNVWRINCMSENKDPYSKLKKQLYLAKIIFHIPNFIKLSLRLLKDRRVPFYLKLLVYGAIAYIISPYDLIPDFLVPFLGFFEDIIIGFLCLTGLVKFSPPEVVAGHVKAIDMENRQRYRFFR